MMYGSSEFVLICHERLSDAYVKHLNSLEYHLNFTVYFAVLSQIEHWVINFMLQFVEYVLDKTISNSL